MKNKIFDQECWKAFGESKGGEKGALERKRKMKREKKKFAKVAVSFESKKASGWNKVDNERKWKWKSETTKMQNLTLQRSSSALCQKRRQKTSERNKRYSLGSKNKTLENCSRKKEEKITTPKLTELYPVIENVFRFDWYIRLPPPLSAICSSPICYRSLACSLLPISRGRLCRFHKKHLSNSRTQKEC